ncbi:MAG: hypothetical protein AVO38_11565 [delta proteobacterium ML8_D]|nr:MAG: hypothetical protein AVO38_11565 [delta proteobacterium ML8_D]
MENSKVFLSLLPVGKSVSLALTTLFAVFFMVAAVSLCDAETLNLRITGLEGRMLKNAEAILAFPPGLVSDGIIKRRWLEHYRKQIPARLSEALEPFGYFHSRPTVELLQKERDRFILRVEVEKGPPVLLRTTHIGVEGPAANDSNIIKKLTEFPLKEGDILRQDYYETGKKELRDSALAKGYLKAEYVSHRILIYPEENLADIDLNLASGPQFFFGDTLFFGADDYPNPFLHHFLAYQPGEIFTDLKRRQTRSNFQRSGRFDHFQLIPRTDLVKDRRVPVEIHLETLPPKRFRTGIGYGDNSGPRLTLNYEDLNVGHLGHEFKTDLTLGKKFQLAEIRYVLPEKQHIDNALAFTLGLQHEETDTYESKFLLAEGEKLFSLGTGRVGSFFLRYKQEWHDIGEVEDTSRLLLAGTRLVAYSFHDPINIRRGYHYRLEARGCAESLLSDVTLLQVLASGRLSRPLTEKFFLLLRLDGGYTFKNNPFKEIPPSLRFFVGGDNSVRGYAHKSRGPRDDKGDVVGGEGLLAGALELEREMGKNWGLAAFYDAGSAFNSVKHMDFMHGVGMGLRIYTPIGPIKVDVAHPLKEKSSSFRVHISIGFEL